MAAAMLAKTEHSRLLVRDLRRARANVTQPAVRNPPRPFGQLLNKVAEMNTPYGLEIVDRLSNLQVAEGSLVLRAVGRYSETAECSQSFEHLSW